VACWVAAAQVVVIQGGQVVVDQRVGMDHLKRRSKLGSGVVQRVVSGHHSGRFDAEDWAQSLAAGERAVPHRAVDGVRWSVGRREEALERLVGEDDSGL